MKLASRNLIKLFYTLIYWLLNHPEFISKIAPSKTKKKQQQQKNGVQIKGGRGGRRFLLNLKNGVVKIDGGGGGVGISKNQLISVMNEKRDINV